jgi:hypothetical protein
MLSGARQQCQALHSTWHMSALLRRRLPNGVVDQMEAASHAVMNDQIAAATRV